jgi:hypothetical protein
MQVNAIYDIGRLRRHPRLFLELTESVGAAHIETVVHERMQQLGGLKHQNPLAQRRQRVRLLGSDEKAEGARIPGCAMWRRWPRRVVDRRHVEQASARNTTGRERHPPIDENK